MDVDAAGVPTSEPIGGWMQNGGPGDALRTLVDHAEITALAVQYCWTIDEHDWDGLDDVFVPEATAEFAVGRVHDGREEIKARIRSVLGPLDAGQHMVSNHQVRVDRDTATHRCQMRAQHVRHGAEGGPNYMVAGRYEDRLLRTADGWRILHRRLVVSWTEGNVRVVRP